MRLPLCVPVGSLEDVILAVEVHNAVLEMELPLVPGPGNLVILTHHHVVGLEQVAATEDF